MNIVKYKIPVIDMTFIMIGEGNVDHRQLEVKGGMSKWEINLWKRLSSDKFRKYVHNTRIQEIK